jgi:hypothetical protein
MGERAPRLFGTGLVVATRGGGAVAIWEAWARGASAIWKCEPARQRFEEGRAGMRQRLGVRRGGSRTRRQGWRRSDDRFMTGTSGLARLVDGMLLAGTRVHRWVGEETEEEEGTGAFRSYTQIRSLQVGLRSPQP